MITVSAFFSGTMNTVDAVIGNFVNKAYINFIQANSEVITLIFTFYIMLIGYQFMTHSRHFNLNVAIKKLIVMLCVFGLVMNWEVYNLFVYNIFTNEPAHITQILVDAASHGQGTATIADTLDDIYEAIIQASIGFFGQVNFSLSGLAFIFYGMMVFVIGTLLSVFALLLFIYAKMMLAISLALGPMFILFYLWEPTRGLFAAWLNKLITIALIPVVTSTILVLMLSVINVTLPNLTMPPEDIKFIGIAPFLGLSLATTLIISQVFRIASALGGGITLASISGGAAIATAAYRYSGAASFARNIGGKIKTRSQITNSHKGGL